MCIWDVFYFELLLHVMCFVTDFQRGRLLGSKTIGTNELEHQFVYVGNS